MSYLDNSEKYDFYNSPSLSYDKSDILFIDNNIIFFNGEYRETEHYIQPKLKDEKTNPKNNSSESNKNASTNPSTSSIKDGPIFQISKTQKNTDNANKTNNPNNQNNTNNTNLGKKRKKGTNYKNGKHDKSCYDNLTRRVKSKVFSAILNFLNSSLRKKFFLQIEKNIKLNTNTEFNQDLLNSKLKDIFSNEIYSKVKKYEKDYNKNLIETIYKENIETKIISILEKTLLECLEHFRGTKYYEELEGLEEEYQNVIDELISIGEGNDYIKEFKAFLYKYEDYYFNIKKAKPKKIKNKKKKKKIENS